MPKKILAVLASLTLLFVVAGCNQDNTQSQKIGVVSVKRVFEESAAAVEGVNYLKGLSAEYQEKLKPMQKKLQEEQSEENSSAFQQAFNEYKAKMNEEQRRILTILEDNFTQVIDEFRENNNYAVIMEEDKVISHGSATDVTSQVIAAMDKRDIVLFPDKEEGADQGMAPKEESAPQEEPAAEESKTMEESGS